MKTATFIVLTILALGTTPLHAQTQSPYGGTNGTIAPGSVIQAENYDVGGEGVSFHDTTAGNTGGVYRTDDVDVEACTDTGGGFNLGWLIDGEWTEYTVNTTAGTYTLTARVASAGATVGDLRVVLDGVVLGTMAVGATGGWQTYADVSLPNVAISGGTNRVFRLEVVSGGDFNVNSVRFTSTGPTPTATAAPTATSTTRATATATTRPTATPAGCAIGATCEAETALLGGGVVASTVHAGYTGTGFADYQGNGTGFVEWTVSVPAAGTYNLNVRYANGGTADRPMSIQVNGTTVVASLSFPVTGWTSWTVRTQAVSLPAGSVRIRATELPNGPNVDNLSVTSTGSTPTSTTRPTATSTTRPTATATATAPRPTATATVPSVASSADTMVHLFEWSWVDVAQECETYLGPKGYRAVQVSPPNEHINDSRWWARYQPVSYLLVSRGGTRAQFIDMVNRCRAVGVDIYADLVLNHTASLNGGGVGWAGTPWSLRSHPMYSNADYHNANCTIDYQDAWSVQNCDLVGLPDLNTGAAYVQQTEANFINDLLGIGVNGFRIDAAKHMSPTDVAGILNRASRNSTVYQEVIDLGGEAVQSSQYVNTGWVEEFKYSRDISAAFHAGQIRTLQTLGSGMLPANKGVVFTDNHDNQRGHGAGGTPLTYKDGGLYDIGNVFMLAWPYGFPRVMSSYDFTDTDIGPPAVPVHDGATLNCFGTTWKCEHRWRPIGNMVAFRRAAGTAAVSNWWDNGNNQIAFARAARGFVVINKEGAALTRTFATSLPAGTYCNIIDGDFTPGTCSGPTITVGATGDATITVSAMRAVAIHVNARL